MCRYPELINVAAFILDRLRRLAPASSAVYNSMPLNESVIGDRAGRLCVKEANTLYLVMPDSNPTAERHSQRPFIGGRPQVIEGVRAGKQDDAPG